MGLCFKSPKSSDRVVATTDGTKKNYKSYKITVFFDLVPASHMKEDINKQKRGAENAAGTSVGASCCFAEYPPPNDAEIASAAPSNSFMFSSSIITVGFWWNVVFSSTATCTDLLCLCQSSSVLFHGHRQVGIKTITGKMASTRRQKLLELAWRLRRVEEKESCCIVGLGL
ncbi:hypothetical protein HN873_045423 [Arachis hypogaea]